MDLVLVVLNRDGVDELLRNEFTLGAQAGVAAGPVGRSAEASTDALMSAKILAYSRAKGLFAGATGPKGHRCGMTLTPTRPSTASVCPRASCSSGRRRP